MAKNIKGRKFVATAATAALVASAIVPVASAADFGDQSKISAWAADAVKHAVEKGYMQGTGGNFTPQGTVTKAQVAQVIYNALGLKAGAPAKFSDVPAGQWYTDAVNALAEKGIATGTEKGTFEPNKNVTLAEAAQMLSKALEIKGTADLSKFADASAVPTWANEAIQALVSNGYIKGGEVNGKLSLDPLGNLTRERLATMFVNIAKGELEEVVAPVTTATKVESVSATNLKQIVVTFDGTVDAATAGNEEYYSTTAGAIASAALLEDGKTVVLTLDTGVVMENQKAYKISISNVKAGDKVITQKDIAFSPLDNVLPTVTSVKSLGNKAIRVEFSEPVKNVTSSHFKLDDKTFFGSVTVTGNVAVLKPYDASALSIGDHKLTVSLVEDYANLKSLTSTTDFTVVEDKEGPTVVEVTATLEKATITFNEDIDPDTVSASDVYWLQGTTKKYAKSLTVVGGTKLVADFSNNPLPAYETTLYIDSVSDYSSNVNSTKEVKVTAQVDQTRPQVTDVKLANNKIDITVKFDKAVSAGDKKYFTLTDKDGKVVPIKSAVAADATNKVFTVSTYSALTTAGTYNLKVSGVQDKTALMNTMLEYNTSFTVGDIGNPTIIGLSASNATRSVVITFSEKMDLASIANPANYLIKFDSDGVNGDSAKLRTLPADVEVRPVQNGTAVLLVFPKQIGSVDVSFPTANAWGSVQDITVTGVKDAAGNILDGYTDSKPVIEQAATVITYPSYTGYQAVQTNQKTIKVKFSQPIGTVSASDFTLSNADGASITSAVANGDVVTLTTNKDTGTDGVTLAVNSDNNIKTLAGNDVAAASVNVYDEVGPVTEVAANTNLTLASDTITLPFSENLSTTTGLPALYANDLVVKDLSKSNGTLTAGVDYTTSVNGKNILITLIGQNLNSDFSVAVKADAKYIQDANGNLAEESVTYQTGNNTGIVLPALTVTSASTNVFTNQSTFAITGTAAVGTTIKVYNDTNNNGVIDSGEAVITTTAPDSTGAYSATVTLTNNAAHNYVVTATTVSGLTRVVDVVGTITHDNVAPILSGFTFNANSTAVETLEIAVDSELDLADGAAVTGFTLSNSGTPVVPASVVYDKANNKIVITSANDGDFTAATVVTYTTATGNVKDLAGNEAPTTVSQ